MHSKNIPLFFIVASLTSTSLGLHHLVIAARGSLDLILARQNLDQCASICSSIGSTVTNCTTTDCLCTTANADGIQTCINCSILLDPSVSVVSSLQSIIDGFDISCASVTGIPSLTINTNTPTSTGTPTVIVQSTVIIPPTTIPQIVIGPSSATTSAPNTNPITQAASSVGSTSTASIVGLPSINGASSNKIILHWTGALLGLAVGNLLVF